jgi:hypothetical protein
MNPKQKAPSMADISKLLKSVGKPGQKQKQKQEAVKKLFKDQGLSGKNPQGIHISEDLSSYPEY